MYKIVFSKQAARDKRLIAQAGLEQRAKALLAVLSENPFQTPPPFEKLVGNLSGFYSRRLNIQHRIVYSVHVKEQTVKVLRMWTHYE